MSWLVSRNEWLRIYSRIRELFPELDFSRDQAAADTLSLLLSNHAGVVDLEELFSYLSSYDTAIVVGCSEELAGEAMILRDILRQRRALIASANGATSDLLSIGITPTLIVTDLDGDFTAISEASARKSIVVIHAHGDNLEKLPLVNQLKGPVIGSTQVEPRPHVHNFGGFTDGDRAVYILFHAGFRKIYLAGFNFEKPSSCRGKHLLNIAVKKKKLEVAKWLISLLEEKGLEVCSIRELT